MALAPHLGAHPEWFAPLYLLAFLSAYGASAVAGYRRGWPPAAWLVVLAAAGVGGVLGTQLLPLAADVLSGTDSPGTTRRLPGTILGSLAAAELARRALGVRLSMLDPLVTGGLVGLVVVRLGCLAAGCCFGTPTDLPWGVTYAEGSVVHGFHLAHGVAEGGATVPVHPVPIYDVLFGVVGLAVLPWARRRLRAPGALCGAAVAAYALHRVAQEAVRADAVAWVGGLTQMQVGMAVVGALAVGAVVAAERRARRCGGEAGAPSEPDAGRLLAALAAVVAVWGGAGGLLSPGESGVLLVRIVPAAVAVGLVVRRGAVAPRLRWATAGLAASLPLMAGFQTGVLADSSAERFRLLAVEGHLATGRYEEVDICATDLYDYRKGGAALALVDVDLGRERTRELGVRAFAGTQETARDPAVAGAPSLGLLPYARIEGRHAGLTVGAAVGDFAVANGEATGTPIQPVFGVRLGPRSSHLQAGYLDQPLFGPPAPAFHLGAGTGRLTATGQELRVQGGVSEGGLYVVGAVPAGRHVLVEPMGAFLPVEGGQTFQVGARIRVQLPAE